MSDSPYAGAPASEPDRWRIAFFGLGQMGLPMAIHLAKHGHEVRGADLQPSACRAFEAAGGQSLEPEEAVHSVELVITMLPDGAAVRSALLDGDSPVAEALSKGTIVVDMSSSSPVLTLELGKSLAACGIELVDAPVSGGVRGAINATLSIMVGGSRATIARIKPLLETMGDRIFETGPLGSGHAMKALNNYVSAAGLVAACEAILVGTRFGLDRHLMVDILNASTGRNNSTETKVKPFILSGAFNSGFGMALMAKDLHTAAEIARHVGVAAPLSVSTRDLWNEASLAMGSGVDHTEIFRYLMGLSSD